MSSVDESGVTSKETEDPPSVRQRNPKRPTMIIVAVFYAILFCMVITGFIIAFSLTN